MPRYRSVWILRGDLSVSPEEARLLTRTAEEDYELLTNSYKGHAKDLDKKGYNLGIVKWAMSKDAILKTIKDPNTAAIAWHSHGDGDILYAAGKASFTPRDIVKSGVSPNLEFVAILGCLAARDKESWLKGFRLDRFPDGNPRLAASGNTISLWQTINIATDRVDDSFGKKFAETHASRAQRLQHYHFPDWVDRISEFR